MPIMFLLLFRYVFGGAIQTNGTTYVNYLVAGILIQNAAFGASTTALNLVIDLKRGIVDRFRSLPMFSPALLVGHVCADMVRNVLALIIMLAVSFLIGFRPTAGITEWFLVIGLLLLFTLAISWLSSISGLVLKSQEAVQWASFMPIMPLTFASSAFVPTDTMPKYLKIFAENQPFTHVIGAMRSWLVGTPMENHGWMSLIWCLGIIIVTMPISIWLFRRYTPQP